MLIEQLTTMVLGILLASMIGGAIGNQIGTRHDQAANDGSERINVSGSIEIPMNMSGPYNMIEACVVPEGSILYRTTISDECLDPKLCGETEKRGLYFANYPLLALGMALEYNTDMNFNVYRVKQPIILYWGKYSFRKIHPDR